MSEPARKRVLVTGAAGFVGSKLTAELKNRLPDADIIPVDRASDRAPMPGMAGGVDIAEADEVDALIAEHKPTTVVHLAAVSAVTSSFADPRQTWRINTMGTLNIVLAIEKHAPDCHLVFVSSAEVYGRSTFSGAPVAEDTLLLPANPYAATKAAADLLVQEAAGRELFATIIRPFNHTGPGQAENFAVPSFCAQIVRIEKSLQEPVIKVGELDDERDFLDVSDVIDLYATVVERGRELDNGLVLNIASGVPRRIRTILDYLIQQSSAKIAIEVDPARLRATRVPRIVGNPARAAQTLGWQPRKAFEQTLQETLQYWRERV